MRHIPHKTLENDKKRQNINLKELKNGKNQRSYRMHCV